MSKRLLVVGSDVSQAATSASFSETFRSHWDVCAVGNGTQALDLLETSHFDAVIAELRLPDQSGTQLLEVVMEKKPSVSRFILADLTDRQAMLKCVGTAHQFLSKPCDHAKIEMALDRSSKIERWFGNPEVKALVTKMRKVPSPPTIYFQIVRELQSLAVSMENIGAIISQDMAVTAKLLQMVNSAAFGLQRPVSSPGEAVMYLGIETTKSLVLLAHTYSHFDRIPAHLFSVESLWRHSLAVGRLARAVARHEGCDGDGIDQSFTAGLLHDMGKLVLAANRPDEYAKIYHDKVEGGALLWEREFQAFGATHAEVGGWLAAIWGLPLEIIEALTLHHGPTKFLSQGFSPLAAVHVADVLEHEYSKAEEQEPAPNLDESFLANLGLADKIDSWRELCESMMPRPRPDADDPQLLAA